jgi:hypothetical protein
MKPNQQILLVLLLITLATVTRLLPHPFNFTPLLAVALLAGRHIPGRLSGLGLVAVSMLVIDLPYVVSQVLPLADMTLLSKIILVNLFVYGTVLGLTLAAQGTKSYRGFRTTLFGSLAASMAFFLITNFASWLAYYPTSWTGLIACYTSAIPYFKNTWFSTLLYSGVLFGCLSLFKRLFTSRFSKQIEGTHPAV